MSDARGRLAPMFDECREQGRAALVGYLPAGFPDVDRSADLLVGIIEAGADLVEIGVPYSDPVIDGPTVQAASETALRAGFRLKDLLTVVSRVADAGGRAVVMSYWNPLLRYGIDAFARDLAAAGGLGVITPDLIPDEAGGWLSAAEENDLDRIFLLAPSSSPERVAGTVAASRGFVYAASTMGVTGARDAVAGSAPELVHRIREASDISVGVGLGIRSGAQAAQVAGYADAVIVGSALVTAVADGPGAVTSLVEELAEGVRSAEVPA